MKTAVHHQAGNRNRRMPGRCLRLAFAVLGIALLLPPPTSAGSPEPEFRWAVQLNPAPDPRANHNRGYALAVDGAGNSFVTGFARGMADYPAPGTSPSFFLSRFGPGGTLDWFKELGFGCGAGVAVDGTGSPCFVGTFYDTVTLGEQTLSSTNGSLLILKHDPSGNLLWARQAPGRTGRVAVDADANHFVAAEFTGTTATLGTLTLTNWSEGETFSDLFAAKLSRSGEVLWVRQIGSLGHEHLDGVAVDSGGNCLVVGEADWGARFGEVSPFGGDGPFVAKYDGAGNLTWVHHYASALRFSGGAASDTAGNCLVAGHFYGTNTVGTVPRVSAGDADVFVAKYSSNGDLLWVSQAGGPAKDEARAIAVDTAGNSYIAGEFEGAADFGGHQLTSRGHTDIFVAKCDPAGNVLWVQQAGGEHSDSAAGIAVDWAGKCYLTGAFQGIATFGNHTLTNRAEVLDLFVAKLGQLGAAIALYAGVTVEGVKGKTYAIQTTTDPTQPDSWATVTNLTLSDSVQLWHDPQPAQQPKRFYRAVELPR